MRPSEVREISYSDSAHSKAGRALIRSIENCTGRIGLIKRAENYDKEIVRSGRNFWEVIVDRYHLDLEIVSGDVNTIPPKGPLVVVSNHPYGILDGLMLGYILSQKRKNFRILANQVFMKSDDLSEAILPICFDDTKEAAKKNITTRAVALEYLKDGGCIGIFPGGTVSTARKPFGKPVDPSWRRFAAKLILKSQANVVPIFFYGSNSRIFQIASHIHYNLRLALLLNEFKRRVDDKVLISIGQSLPSEEITELKNDSNALMEYLRLKTYGLSVDPEQDFECGFEFDNF
ncbi:MAG: lysophospholipid acyltransferase family protein [Pseudomonadota bacterium]|nr:lysophospholipid acyltransferase family protein [Pseudomonadota bacterium]